MNKKQKNITPNKPASPAKQKAVSIPLMEKFPWMEYVIVGLTILVLFFIRRNFIGIAMERDEGSYAMLGNWLIGGAKPYVDFYEMKPPGLFIVYGLLVKIFGYDATSLQSGFCYVYALILLFSFLFFRNFIGKNIAMTLLPVLGLLLMNLNISGFTIQSEFLVLLFVVSGMYLFTQARLKNNLLLFIGAGILLGFSVLIKQAGIFYCIFGALWLVMDWWKNRNHKQSVIRILVFTAGGIISIAAVFIWLQMFGVVKDALFWFVEFPGKYYLSDQSFSAGMDLLKRFGGDIMNQQPVFFVLAFAGMLLGMFLKISRQEKIIFYSFIVLSSLAIVPGLRFTSHYWILFTPGIALAISFTYRFLNQLTQKNSSLNTGLAIVFILIPVAHVFGKSDYYLKPDFNKILHGVYGSNPFPETKIIGEYLKKNMKQGDNIFIAGSEPELYLYTNTMGVTRHNFIGFFNLKSPYAKQWQEEAIKDVETKKPRYFVFVNHPLSWMLAPDAETTFFKWTQSYMPANYKVVFIADQYSPGDATNYIEGNDAATYQIKGKQFIVVWERVAQ